MPRPSARICTAAALLLAALAGRAPAAPPVEAADRAAVAGQPAALEVYPPTVALTCVRDARQLVVTGKYADGTLRDLTAVATAQLEPADVVVLQDGLFLRPKKDGTTPVVIAAGGKEARVPVTVAGMTQP